MSQFREWARLREEAGEMEEYATEEMIEQAIQTHGLQNFVTSLITFLVSNRLGNRFQEHLQRTLQPQQQQTQQQTQPQQPMPMDYSRSQSNQGNLPQ